jgi:hypothetical protein
MSGKILTINLKVPQVTSLPDGYYIGTWGGSTIVVNYKDKTYELTTEIAVKGFGYRVVVEINDGVAVFHEINN